MDTRSRLEGQPFDRRNYNLAGNLREGYIRCIFIGADIYTVSGDPKLKMVKCKAAIPPTITAAVFKNTPIASVMLRVPAGSKALYQAAEGWKDFGTIEEY